MKSFRWTLINRLDNHICFIRFYHVDTVAVAVADACYKSDSTNPLVAFGDSTVYTCGLE